MRYLGDDDSDIEYVTKNMPSRSNRSRRDFWENQSSVILDDKLIDEELNAENGINYQDNTRDEWRRNVVMRLYLRILSCIAESVYGPESATASMTRFIKWLPRYTGNVLTDSTLDTIAPAAQAWVSSKSRSVERRVIRAVLCETYPHAKIRDAKNMFGSFYISQHAYYQGREDFCTLTESGCLPKYLIPKQSFKEEVVSGAIKWILSFDNVAYLSWGTKRIILDGKVHDVPSILRRRTVQLIYDSYLASRDGTPPLPKSTFYRVCTILTHGEVRTRQAVDYVTGSLINDNFNVLERIINEVLPHNRILLLEQFDSLKSWLKYDGFCTIDSIQEGLSSCPRHDAAFGLTPCPLGGSPNERFITCAACRSADNLFNSLIEQIKASDTDSSTLQVVKDAHEKIQLFTGHRLRVLNQQKQLQKVADEMKERRAENGISDEAIVVLDYKMKFDPLYFREKTVDHYGKRGMTWHGVMVRFWQMEPTDNGDDAVETKLYFDHIAADDNKPDKESVSAFFEAMLLTLQRDTPHVKHLVVQSDNATNYQNPFITMVIPVLGWVHGICVDRFIHSETRDRKSLLDAHFARATGKVKTWVQQGNDCTTPQQLVAALTADGGLPNCVAELVQYNRDMMKTFYDEIAPTLRCFSKFVDRVNDVVYHYPEHAFDASQGEMFTFGSCPPYNAQVFSNSVIREGINVEVCLQLSTCTRCSSTTTSAPAPPISLVDDRTRMLHPNEPDEDDDVFESISGTSGADIPEDLDFDFGEGDLELEDVDHDEEVVLPSVMNGTITGVTIITAVQIRLRDRSWNKTSRSMLLQLSARQKNPYPEKDVAGFVKRSLLNLQETGRLGIIQSSDLTNWLVTSCGLVLANSPSNILKQGWAIRPPKGKMYGAKYVKLYAGEILEMFVCGEKNTSEKLGPSRMLEKLKMKHPKCYNLPSENDIRGEVSRLIQSRKRQLATTDSISTGSSPPKKLRYRMPNHYTSFLRKLVEQDSSIRPAVAVAKFRSEFPNSVNDATTDQVSHKVSSLKQQAKQNRGYQSPIPNE
jgi:hypothetical protein